MMRLTANLPQYFNQRDVFQEALHRTVDHRDWFISIIPPDYADYVEEHIETPAPSRTLFLQFEDTGIENEHTFDDEQARLTADFIRECARKDANVWVNCIAGISRSGAIVDILLRLGWHDLKHNIQEERHPNPIVWTKLAAQFPELKGVSYPKKDVKTWEAGVYDYLNRRHGPKVGK